MILFVATFAILNKGICDDESKQPGRAPTISITCAKESVLAGEPVPLTLTIVNHTAWKIQIEEGRPDFYACTNSDSLVFSDLKKKIVPLPREGELLQQKSILIVGGGRHSIITLLPGQSLRKTLYLQRYIKPLPVGTHFLDYHVKSHYDINKEKNANSNVALVDGIMSRRGKIKVSIKRGTDAQLQAVIKYYASLLGRENSYRAEEAMCLIDNPAVIPHLIKILADCPNNTHMLFTSMRISNQDNALVAVRACLKNSDPRVAANAVHVLSVWKEIMEVDEVERLLNSSHPIVIEAALRYIHTLNRLILTDSQFQKFVLSSYLSMRLLLYVAFPHRCEETWEKNLLNDVRRLVRPLPSTEFAQLLRDLDDDSFIVRERASAKLEHLGERVEAHLKQASHTPLSLEAKRRVRFALEKIAATPRPPDCDRVIRYLIEAVHTPEADAVLATLADGDPNIRLTQYVKKALKEREKPPSGK
jgi:hypothetical protein